MTLMPWISDHVYFHFIFCHNLIHVVIHFLKMKPPPPTMLEIY